MKNINYQQKEREIISWLKSTVKEAGFGRVIVAVSGGVDSAVSLNLAVRALGASNVYAILMPYGKLSSKALSDGKIVARSSGLEKDHIFVKDIKKAADKILKITLRNEMSEQSDEEERLPRNARNDVLDNIRKGNIMARIRMIFLYDCAKALNALVVGTENKSEYYLGYFTRFGDEASDIEPIRSLYKTQIWEMAKYLGVQNEIIEKAPSANLWEGQSDERELGFSYLDADRVLYHFFEEKLPREGIIALGFEEKLVDGVLGFVRKNDFKHKVPFVMK